MDNDLNRPAGTLNNAWAESVHDDYKITKIRSCIPGEAGGGKVVLEKYTNAAGGRRELNQQAFCINVLRRTETARIKAENRMPPNELPVVHPSTVLEIRTAGDVFR